MVFLIVHVINNDKSYRRFKFIEDIPENFSEYDIHRGGNDLIFPHHEAEIAQMRSISGKKYLARYWIHTGMVNINKEKMSKFLSITLLKCLIIFSLLTVLIIMPGPASI